MEDLSCLDKIQAQVNSIQPPDADIEIGFETVTNKSNIGLDGDCYSDCEEIVIGSFEFFMDILHVYFPIIYFKFTDVFL